MIGTPRFSGSLAAWSSPSHSPVAAGVSEILDVALPRMTAGGTFRAKMMAMTKGEATTAVKESDNSEIASHPATDPDCRDGPRTVAQKRINGSSHQVREGQG